MKHVEKYNFRRLHAMIPAELFYEIKKRGLQSKIDGIVTNLLVEYLDNLDNEKR